MTLWTSLDICLQIGNRTPQLKYRRRPTSIQFPRKQQEEVAATLATRNSEVVGVDMEMEENQNDDWNPTERVGTSLVEGVETSIDVPERREIVIVTDEEEEAEMVPPSEETAGVQAAAIRTYQRRPTREETSERRSEGEQQRGGLGQSTGGYEENPTRSTDRVPARKRRLLLDEETEEEEEASFTPLEELSSLRQPDAPAEAADSKQERGDRKRKGKPIATPAKKKPRQASSTLVIHERDPSEVRQWEEGVSDEEEAQRLERQSK